MEHSGGLDVVNAPRSKNLRLDLLVPGQQEAGLNIRPTWHAFRYATDELGRCALRANGMKAPDRRRRYIRSPLLWILRPFFRYSESRRAYILRLVGERLGPVLRPERRAKPSAFPGPERRGALTEDDAFQRVW